MTVTLDLKPEVEEHIKAEANARGLSVEDYILQELETRLVSQKNPNGMPYEEWLKALDDFIKNFPRHPILSDEAISRESIYREREDAQL